jgi:hypothetical protein
MANLQETYRRFIGVGACSISPIDEPTIVMAFPRLSALSIADNLEQGKIMANTDTQKPQCRVLLNLKQPLKKMELLLISLVY